MPDFSSASAAELRKMLVASGKYTEEDANNIKGKSALVKCVLELNGNEENDEIDIFDKLMKSVETTNGLLEDNQIAQPELEVDYNSPNWHDYVMKQFAKDEVIDDKYPTLY